MAAITKNFYIEQGTDWELRFLLRDDTRNIINLQGYTAELKARATVDATPVLFTLSTSNGGIVITPTTGEIKLLITATASSAFTFLTGVYDLEITDNNTKVFRLSEGNVYISQGVTR